MQRARVQPSHEFIEFKNEDIEGSIHLRFEQMAEKYPDRLALKTLHHQWTYRELNRIANRIGRSILKRCGEKEEPIALLLDQGAFIIAALMGVLKAGKFYVPIDPSFPVERITQILEDSGAGLILTNNENLQLAKEVENAGPAVLNLDHLDGDASAENLGLDVMPESLAWVIYTSGSTGRPKGVSQSHRNVLHETKVYTNRIRICIEDRLVLPTLCSSAASVRSICGALVNGASLFPFDVRKEGIAGFCEWMAQQEITIWRSVPTVFRHVVGHLKGKRSFPSLRIIYFGGETVYKNDIDLFQKHFSLDCTLVCGYGATECFTVGMNVVDRKKEIETETAPIGFPIEGKEVFLLDENGNDLGKTGVGEIAVRSAYLSPGYWKRPDLTEEVFLSDPSGNGERIYLTGDLGQYLPDGSLIHMGRKDFQVKVRGQRVELAEIEAALAEHTSVQESVVVARPDPTSENRLSAYVVLSSAPSARVSEFRKWLEEKFPAHMVPAAFVVVDAMPLTPAGKVDRLALPDPGNRRPELETPYVPPSTPFEKEVAQMWSEVLGLDEVGVQDAFLDIGGDSLRATQLISRVLEKFQVEIPIQALMQAPTIAKMAEAILQHRANQIGPDEMESLLDEVESTSESD